MPFFDKYPYTNFHNVNLDWVLEKVKELENHVSELHDYVTNLDYQQMITDTIESLITSGRFNEIVNPVISQYVTSWLDAHISQPVDVIIDDSLSISGAAADAKATGELIERDRFTSSAKYALVDLIDNLEFSATGGRNLLNVLSVYLDIYDYEFINVVNTGSILYGGLSSLYTGYPVGNPLSEHYNNTNNSKRVCYTFFSFPVETGYKYRVIFNSFAPDVEIAVQCLTEEGYNKAINQENLIFADDVKAIGTWSKSGYEFQVTESGAMWCTFRYRIDGVEQDITPDIIQNMALYRKEV